MTMRAMCDEKGPRDHDEPELCNSPVTVEASASVNGVSVLRHGCEKHWPAVVGELLRDQKVFLVTIKRHGS